jgi:hypothetical protein
VSNQSRRTAIKALAALTLTGLCSLALAAQVAGTVVNLSGPLLARKDNGTVKVLALKSEVEQGDTLVTEKNTYAQIRFVDNSDITLKPNTTFKVEAFAFDAGKPDADSASFNLIKGGLRSVTGLLGKRNREKFQLRTPGATIGIRGTTFGVQWVEGDGEQLRPGLHVRVLDGLIQVSNAGGAQLFSAGQFGFVGGVNMAPVVVPANPGMTYSPPPSFTSVDVKTNDKVSMPETKVDCEVR